MREPDEARIDDGRASLKRIFGFCSGKRSSQGKQICGIIKHVGRATGVRLKFGGNWCAGMSALKALAVSFIYI